MEKAIFSLKFKKIMEISIFLDFLANIQYYCLEFE